MGVITLQGMEFFAYHGCNKGERKTGNKFIVDITFYAQTDQAEKSDDLSKTVNYKNVYEVVKNEMAIPSRLIEHVARRIMDVLIKKIPNIKDINIAVAKLNPPLGGKVEKVQFSLQHKA